MRKFSIVVCVVGLALFGVVSVAPTAQPSFPTVATMCVDGGSTWVPCESGGGGGGTPGGSNTQVQFNNAGAFGGITGATTNGTVLTLVAPVLGAATATSLDLSSTGARVSAADGVLTLLGLGDGNDENLTIDFDNAAANAVAFASGTGVTDWTMTARLQMPNGTQALPAYSFTGDPNTGFYSSGDGILNLSVDNTRIGLFTSSLIGYQHTLNFQWYTAGFAGVSVILTDADAASGVLSLKGPTNGAALQLTEQTAPAAGAANTARLYAVDNGGGKTQLCVLFNSGAAQCFATEP